MFHVGTLPLETTPNPVPKLPDDSLAKINVEPQPYDMVDDGIFLSTLQEFDALAYIISYLTFISIKLFCQNCVNVH